MEIFVVVVVVVCIFEYPYRSISKCGKISKLLVKYPLCCGQLNHVLPAVGGAYL